jgi:hypothetical protein
LGIAASFGHGISRDDYEMQTNRKETEIVISRDRLRFGFAANGIYNGCSQFIKERMYGGF